MHVNLRFNGLYACAENGGDDVGVVHVNRPAAGAWEDWEEDDLGGGLVSLRSSNGRYLCAEGGGGGDVHANRTGVGPWEQFVKVQAAGLVVYVCHDGVHMLGVGTDADRTLHARTPLTAFERIQLGPSPAPAPSPDTIARVRGNMASMRDSAGRIMVSWFYPLLRDAEQADWRARWRAAGLTHVLMCPVMSYPGYWAGSADWRDQPDAFAAAVADVLAEGFVPMLQMTSGDRDTGADVDRYWPALFTSLRAAGVLPSCWVSCGFEVVGPGGGWRSAELSHGLNALQALAPEARIMVHLQPERATGASHPVEPDDPWHGDEAGFWTSHGGQYAQALYYQTPHDAKLLDPNGGGPGIGAWEDRFVEILDRLGKGALGWRKVYVILGEKTAYNYYDLAGPRQPATDADVVRTSQRGASLAAARGVDIGYGDGLP